MHVYRNGHLLYTWPISTGRPGDDTPDGTYLTIDKGNPVLMTGPGLQPGGALVGAVHLDRRLPARRVLVGGGAGRWST